MVHKKLQKLLICNIVRTLIQIMGWFSQHTLINFFSDIKTHLRIFLTELYRRVSGSGIESNSQKSRSLRSRSRSSPCPLLQKPRTRRILTRRDQPIQQHWQWSQQQISLRQWQTPARNAHSNRKTRHRELEWIHGKTFTIRTRRSTPPDGNHRCTKECEKCQKATVRLC